MSQKLPIKSGIYKISAPSGNFYIGSSVNISARWSSHKSVLRKGKHHCSPLQKASNKYGYENFVFEILEECEKDSLLLREQFYVDTLKPAYNTARCVDRPMLGRKPSEETRKKMSEWQKGEKSPRFGKSLSSETRAKISKSAIGKSFSEESRKKMGAWQIGRIASDEVRQKMSRAHMGKRHAPETLAKLGNGRRQYTEEHCISMFDLRKEGASIEYIAKKYNVSRTTVYNWINRAKAQGNR